MASNEDRQRNVVPRWRRYTSTISAGELRSVQGQPNERVGVEALEDALEDWRSNPSPSVAGDLVSIAMATGCTMPARSAAEYLLRCEGANAAMKAVATGCLTEGQTQPAHTAASLPALADECTMWADVAQTRVRLSQYPRNPVLWTNLALLYTILGLGHKAERSMRIALGQAGSNRFVLRSASRLFLHMGNAHYAHRVLLQAPNLVSDPWLMAAEIAIANAANRTPLTLKQAIRHLADEKSPPFHCSELAAAVATMDAYSGNAKRARKFIRISLTEPSENAVAQAAWLARNGFGLAVGDTGSYGSFEANAYCAVEAGKFNVALQHAKRWQHDQPFSSRPAILGSYIASRALEEHQTSIAMLRRALVCNPDDFMLHNNLAFAYAQRGACGEATKALAAIDRRSATLEQRVVLTATTGLIAYRAGDSLLGKSLYRQAIADASQSRHRDILQVSATAYLALEELRCGSCEAETFRQEALTLAQHTQLDTATDVLLVRLRSAKPFAHSGRTDDHTTTGVGQ